MQIAIDGPAGAGKSTVAKLVAIKLNYLYIDTGAMYRALTYYLLEHGIDLADEDGINQALINLDLRLVPATTSEVSCEVFIGDKNVTREIRQPIVSQHVSQVSGYGFVREAMVKLQQKLADSNNVVMDGRDIGTTVLPDADLKIYLSASVTERARRRHKEMLANGHQIELATLLEDIKKRDHLDSTRAISPLCKAEDAIEIETTNLTIDQVVEQIQQLALGRTTDV